MSSQRKLETCFGVLCVGLAVFLCSSCAETAPAPAGPTAGAALPAIETNRNVVPPLVGAAATSKTEADPSGAPAPTPPVSAAPASNDSQSRIRLSAGVALAQTLPDGTSVMCSMDYEWIQGSPQQGVDYVWVVELGNGDRLAAPAKVSKRRGNMQTILRGIRPDQGPFKGAIFAKAPGAAPEPISDFVPLK
jgi:hypothetical protein